MNHPTTAVLLICLIASFLLAGGSSCADLNVAYPLYLDEPSMDSPAPRIRYANAMTIAGGASKKASAGQDNDSAPIDLAGDKQVARVNGEPIFYSEVRILVEPGFREVSRRLKGAALESKSDQLWEAALRGLIDRRLLLQKARTMNIRVDKSRVKERLEQKIAAKGSLKALFASLPLEDPYALVHTKGRMDSEGLEAYFEQEMIIDDLLENLVGSRFGWNRFDPDSDYLWIEPEELRAYYVSHLDEFTQPEKVCFSQIVCRAGEDHPKALEHMQQALQQIASGEDFAQVARAVSQGPRAADGGLWKDLVTYDQLHPTLGAALAGLKVGQTSDILEVDYGNARKGYHVVKLERCLKKCVEPFTRAQFKIRRAILASRHAEATQRLLKKLRRRANIQTIRLVEMPLYVRER